jgi:eukaryotic-like serine/threonine-protein kinase
MRAGLQIARELRDGSVVMRGLAGSLDEHLRADVVDASEAKQIILDLKHVKHVSSFGVREWVNLVKRVRKSVEGLYFLWASPRVTDQFNMVVGFDGGGSLLSFETTYVCETCGQETSSLFDTQLDRGAFDSMEAPGRQCQWCGREAQLDDDPAILFEYVRSVGYTPPPMPVMQLIRRPDSWVRHVPGDRLTIRHPAPDAIPTIELAGIIDGGAAIDVSQLAGEKVRISVRDVIHVDTAGTAPWRDAIRDLLGRSQVVLSRVPPVMLRRAIEDPTLFAGTSIESAALSILCRKCQKRTWVVVPQDFRQPLNKLPTGACKQCNNPTLEFPLPAADLEAFARVLREPPPPAPLLPLHARATEKKEEKKTAAPAATPSADAIENKYEVLCKIGQGGMAEVYLARQLGAMGFRRLVVLKKVLPDLLTDDRMVRLFLDEARVAAEIAHTNVIRVHDLGRDNAAYFMAMEFVHGRSLVDALRQMRPGNAAPPYVAASIAADLCSALAQTHLPDAKGNQLIHRDVTPGNVLVSFDGIVKLADFGLAGYRHFNKDKLRSGLLLGSASYIAPEIYLGEDARPQSDIWGVGLLLYVLLTCEHPFKRDTVENTARAVVNDRVRRPWGKIPRKLFAIIERALVKDPKARYTSAKDMENDLRAVLHKLKRNVTVAEWIRDLFKAQIEFENKFTDASRARNLTDALLRSSPQEVERFYKALWNVGSPSEVTTA